MNSYNPETVIHNKTGFIVSDKDEMIKSLNTLITNQELRKKFSIEAVKRAKEFDWNNIVKRWEKIFMDIVKNNQKV
jgi:glycosyltransferase involved in cell wall biosynthesis